MRVATKFIVVVFCLSALVACGKRKDAGEGLVGQEPCGPAQAELTQTNLPAHFPDLDGVIYTATAAAGPSTTVTGYANNTLAGLFKDLQEKFGADPYAILKKEKDAHDAEVNFSSDSDKVTGQVALSEECKGRLHVRVIVRPK